MRVLLLELDGHALPNVALMRIAADCRERGHSVELRRDIHTTGDISADLFGPPPGMVYASAIFEWSQPLVRAVRQTWKQAAVGGTGCPPDSPWKTLDDAFVHTREQDYSIYPEETRSIGFTSRGCRFRCPYCVVPRTEGHVHFTSAVRPIWRGNDYPKHILLLDPDFFGQIEWEARMRELIDGRFRVCFNQGINVRGITAAQAQMLAWVDYRDDSMKDRRIYTAWDNGKQEKEVLKGLKLLITRGVKPRHIMVYMLLGFYPWSDEKDWQRRHAALRDLGVLPYPMPYARTVQAVGFQRWVIGAYDKRVSWAAFSAAGYDPRRLKLPQAGQAELQWR